MTRYVRNAVFVGLLLAWALPRVHAQDAAPTAPSPPPEETTTPIEETTTPVVAVALPEGEGVPAEAAPAAPVQLEEIVVTATKRATNLREIPASITALGGSDLEERGVQGVEDVAKLVPGLNVSDSGVSATRVTIRGVASDNFTSATTGILFGDVSFVDVYFPIVALDPNPFDLKTVEVLKGPQGTLFGASALNGAVRYVPQGAEIGTWSSRLFLQGNRVTEGDKGWSGGGALNVPLGSSAAARFVGFYRDIPGIYDNDSAIVHEKDSNAGMQVGGRIMLDWQPSDAWDVGLVYARQRTRYDDLDTADNTDGDLSSSNRPGRADIRSKYQVANLKLRYSFADWGGEVISDSAYVEKDGSRNLCNSAFAGAGDPPFCFLRLVSDGHSTTVSQEFRLVSPTADSDWKYIAGISGFQQDIDTSVRTPFGATADQIELLDQLLPGFSALLPPDGGTVSLQDLDLDVTAKELAGFGEVTRTLGSFDLTLGGRYYVTRSGGDSIVSGPLTALVALNRTPRLDETITERGFNPKASLVFHATDDAMAYVTVSRGFRVGGVQPGSPFLPSPSGRSVPSVFKSDTIWSYEGGVRTAWLHNTLQADVTVYALRWKNPQLLQPDGAGIGNYLDNVGGVKGRGLEAGARYLTPFGLQFMLAGAYSRMRTTEPFEASSGTIVPVGSRWPMAPSWQTTTTVSYPTSFGSWSLVPSVTHAYISHAPFDLNSQYPVLGYQQWDAGLALKNPAIAWFPDVSLSATNLADKRALIGFVGRTEDNNNAAGTYTRYIAPRTILLRLSKDF